MTIGEKAKKWYDENEPDGGFAKALLRCFLYGLLIKRPNFVLMAEQVVTDGERIVEVGPGCKANCYWVHFVAAPGGTTTPYDFMDEAPYPLPYIAFKNRGKTRVYTWDHIRKDIYGRSTVSPSTDTT